MKHAYYRLSLKQRIQLFYILLTVFCILVTGMLSDYFASRVMERNALGLSQNTLNKSAQVLDEHLRHVIVSSYTLMLSDAFVQTMKDVQAKNNTSYYRNLSALQVPFVQLKLNEPLVESVLLNTPIGDFYATKDTKLASTDYYREFGSWLDRPSWSVQWIGSHEDSLFVGGKRVLSLLLRPLSSQYSSDVFLTVNLNEALVREIVEENLIDDQVGLYLLDADGSEVVRPSSSSIDFGAEPAFLSNMSRSTGKGFFRFTDRDGNRQLVNYAGSTMNDGWTLVGVQSEAELLRPMKNIRWLILIIMAACVIVALLFSKLLSDVLLKPLYKLRRLMAKVEKNDLDVRFESPYEDEVGHVGHKFNRMLEQLQTLIAEVKASEQEKRKSEIKALQSQIEPHFLYNTLNTIYWKSESEEYADVQEMIVSLSLLFRLGLNNGNEITTLEKELDHVRQYLFIQQKCYEDRFDFSISLQDRALLSMPILKILLQPLVENSILHGFEHVKEHGMIRIDVRREGSHLRLRVADNGSGMDVDQVLRRMNEPDSSLKGYALANVRARLTLYYGAQASMTLTSDPGRETAVTLLIPMPKEEYEWNGS
ncbi:cache domain-containing sensor histidine kinase [Cohnella fermenti]|uniref:histidine kinase n=1 Tax=Cohnella fermenti TaxID=2565925 RepID=A0A4S4BLB2_9BACL|nr:histidine kinase [Cohnella fermenti]THF75351.1 HAMP domain-containing protein [Cohnella fermenti]